MHRKTTQLLRGLSAGLCLVAGVTWSSVCLAQGSKPEEVRLLALQGDELVGKLLTMTTEKVVVEVRGGQVERKSNEINRLEFSGKLSANRDPLELNLVDGTRLYGAKLFGKESAWQFGDSAGSVIELGPGVLKSALVRPLANELRPAWENALKESADSDALIVSRPGNVLDRVNGLISEVKDAKVIFDLDGQSVDVSFEKLAGIIWFRRGGERVKPTIEVRLTDHSIWYAESIRMNADSIELQPLFGKPRNFALSKLLSVDYSHANLKWLYEVEPMERIAEKRVDWKADIPALQKALAPRFSLNAKAESISKLSSDYDLDFPAPGRFVFRVPDGFNRLEATIERAQSGDQRSDLRAEVWQDDQVIWQQPLPAKQDTLSVDVPVVAGKKIRLVTACDTKLMVGTSVRWLQPRLRR